MTMNESKSATKDPICGMTVDEATALHAERDGKTFYFCSEHCRGKFLSEQAPAKADSDYSGGKSDAGSHSPNITTIPITATKTRL